MAEQPPPSRGSNRSADSQADEEQGKPSLFKDFSNKASGYHARVPYLQKLPFAAVAIIVTLVAINLLVWAAVGAVLVNLLSSMQTVGDD